MKNITHVKPVLPVSTYLEIAKLLVKVGGESLSNVGELMLKTYEANMLEFAKPPKIYEETNNVGSPETYNGPSKCEEGVCD